MLSSLPAGVAAYRFIQRYLTRSLIPNEERKKSKVKVAVRYWECLRRLGMEDQARNGMHLDFGAGWHPTIPFVFRAMGVQKQRLLDMAPVMDSKLLFGGLEIIRTIGPAMLENAGLKGFDANAFSVKPGTVSEILGAAGMTYDAPYDGLLRKIGGQASFATSTQVLLHIPESILASCFADLFHALEPGGLFMATVHLYPLYGGLTTGPEAYEHLAYSPEEWEKFGSSIMYYQRLKAPDYRRLLEAAGFTIAEWDVTEGSPQNLATVKSLPVHDCFSQYSREELAARHLFFAAKKPR